jgi:outer membrane protein TolC
MPARSYAFIASFVIASMFAGCATEQYQAKPLSAQTTFTQLNSRDPNSSDFQIYLTKQGFQADELPIKTWGLRELTQCGLFFNPRLDVVKSQLSLAKLSINSANIKQNPSISGNLAHSNQANGDIRPWAYGLQVEIPIETTKKRAIRVEEAEHLAEAAQLDVAEAAWQLRQEIAADLLQLHENTSNIAQLTSELAIYQQIFDMLQKRVDSGLVSNTELQVNQLALQNIQFELNKQSVKKNELLAKLAADCGVSLEKFSQLKLKPFNLDATLKQQISAIKDLTATQLQESSLLNRIDIRRSLAKYAAAESKIKLEIAKQTPDLSISPGLAFEFGDSIWSLGINALLNLSNKNQTMIAEAKQLREIEASQFEALQAQIIGNTNQAKAQYTAALQLMQMQEALYNEQRLMLEKQQSQLNAGLIDRLNLTQTNLSLQQAELQLRSAQFAVLQAALRLEDVLQIPIEVESMQGKTKLSSELMQ